MSLAALLRKAVEGHLDTFEVINIPGLKGEDIVEAIEKNSSVKVISSADGKIGTVENQENIKDWGKNNSAFPFHLDGPYYLKVPQWVILYCETPSTTGGETFLASGAQVIEKLREKFDNNLLESTNIVYLSSDRKKYCRPFIEKVRSGEQLNWYSSLYLEPDLQKISDENRRMFTQLSSELSRTVDILLKENIILEHSWQKGDLLLFNNNLVLHGRNQIGTNSDRLLYRIWFDSVDFKEIKDPMA